MTIATSYELTILGAPVLKKAIEFALSDHAFKLLAVVDCLHETDTPLLLGEPCII